MTDHRLLTPSAPERHVHAYRLPTGELHLDLPAHVHPEDYFRVEARQNPKRGFLFVSTLLGKHLPVPVGRLHKVHAKLTRELLATWPAALQPTLVIGMAETATMLGYGVWRTLDAALAEQHQPSYYLQTTRYRLDQPAWAFEESHSHAPSQWLHGLDDPRLQAVRRVVLVDDELSTGKTFHALEAVIRAQLPHVERVDWVCLTDFRPLVHQDHPAVAMLRGAWSWQWTHRPETVPVAEGQAIDPRVLQADFGRAKPLDREQRRAALSQARRWREAVRPQGQMLVLGTGEFMPLPLELADELAVQPGVTGVDFQATTRSPALMPVTPLGLDHYGEGVPQYLYHYTPDRYDQVVVAVETPMNATTEALGITLQATVVSPDF